MNKKNTSTVNALWGNISISTKFMIPMIFCMIILFSISSWITIKRQEDSLNKLLQVSQNITQRNNQLLSLETKQGEHKKVEIISQLLAVIMPNLIAELDMEAMSNLAKVVGNDSGINYIEVKNSDNIILSKYGKKIHIIEEQTVLKKIIFEGNELGEILISYNLNFFKSYMEKLSEREKTDILEITNKKHSYLNSAKIDMLIITIVFVIILLSLLWFIFKIFILSRLNKLLIGMHDIAQGEGDLTQRMKIHGKDEIDKVGIHYNSFLKTIHSTINQVSDTTDSLDKAAKKFFEITSAMRTDVLGQQKEINLVATAVYEMSMSIQEVANNASKAATSANDANESSQKGESIVNSTISTINVLATEINNSADVINHVKADSKKIGKILDVIKEIANQTNLLALNAAIEAARAGDTGRGFAVVADEVRALASRTQQSTVEIQNMIEQLQSGSENAVSAMKTGQKKVRESVKSATLTGHSFKSIAEFVSQISDMNSQISCAADEQSNVAEEVNISITRIKDIGVRAAKSTEHTAESSQELSILSSNLKNLVEQFKL